MVDKGKRKTQSSGRADIETDTSVGINLTATINPELASNNKQTNSNKKAHYGEYVIWFLILAAFLALPTWRRSREFLDAHSGMVSAIGTIAIMLLTIAYVRYSRHQWRVMDGQLGQMRQQFPEMQKSTQAAIDSAKAAKASADALINIERAWIFVDVSLVGGKVIYSSTGSQGDKEGTQMELSLRCRNVGKSPAWITQKLVHVEIIPPSNSTAIDFESLGATHLEIEPIEAGQDISSPHSLWTEGRPGNMRLTLVLGIVKYRDIFGEKRQTIRGYMLSPDERRLEPIISPDYNHYT